MLQKILRFFLALFLVLSVLYGVHRLILENFFPGNNLDFLNFCYKFNLGVTVLFTLPMLLFGKKLKNQIGYLFVAEGFVKLGLFLFLIHMLEFHIDKSNFLVFFVPYLGCLGVELFFVLRLLKELDG